MTTVYGNFKIYEEAFEANPVPVDGKWYGFAYTFGGDGTLGKATVELSPQPQKGLKDTDD